MAEDVPFGVGCVLWAECDTCQVGYCPGGDHPWAGPEDIAWAAKTGRREPTGRCGCPCALGPTLEEQQDCEGEDSYEVFSDGPCPLCGEQQACGYDTEGRPMIHVLNAEGDE